MNYQLGGWRMVAQSDIRLKAQFLKIGDDFVLMRHLAATLRQKQCLRRWDVLAPM
jgi:hypothetical protein